MPREWTATPRCFLPRVVTGRALLSRKQHRLLLAAPNFRHDRSLPQPPQPNLAPGPVGLHAKRASLILPSRA